MFIFTHIEIKIYNECIKKCNKSISFFENSLGWIHRHSETCQIANFNEKPNYTEKNFSYTYIIHFHNWRNHLFPFHFSIWKLKKYSDFGMRFYKPYSGSKVLFQNLDIHTMNFVSTISCNMSLEKMLFVLWWIPKAERKFFWIPTFSFEADEFFWFKSVLPSKGECINSKTSLFLAWN